MTERDDTRDEGSEKTVVTEIIFSTELGHEPTRVVRHEAVEPTVVDYVHQDGGTGPSWEPTHHDARAATTRVSPPPAAPDERGDRGGMAGHPAREARPRSVPAPQWLNRAEKRWLVAAALLAAAVMACAYVLGYWHAS